MISEEQVKEMIITSLTNIKVSDPVYAKVELTGSTILLGVGGPFDSIAFTAFATEFEEKMEEALGEEYMLQVDDLFLRQKGKATISVDEAAKHITKQINHEHKYKI